MADTTLTVDVDTSSAQTKLARLEASFNTLKAAILGVGFVAAIQQANEYANAIKDISTTADISVGKVIALSRAFETSGGTAEGAQTAILKFAQSVGDAINGSDAAQKAFGKIGVSLKDIQQLSQEELLAKSIAGISGLESAAQRLRIQTELFGKGARSVNFPEVNQGLGAAGMDAQRYQSAIQAGSDASENLQRQLGNLRQALLNVAEPLNKIVAGINTSVTAFESLIKALLLAGGSFLILTRGVSGITALMGGFASSVAGGVGVMGALFGSLITDVGLLISRFGRLGATTAAGISSFSQLGLIILGVVRLLARFAGIAGLIYAIVEAVDFLTKKFLDFSIIDWVIQKFITLKDVIRDALGFKPDGPDQSDAETKRLEAANAAIEARKKQQEEAAAKAKEFAERQAKLAAEIRRVGDEYKYQNEQQLKAIALQTSLVGKSEDEIQMAQGLAEIYNKQNDTIKGLLETRRQWASGTTEQQSSVGIIDREIARVKALTAEQAKRFKQETNALQGAQILERDRLANLDRIIAATDRQIAQATALKEAQLGIREAQQTDEFARSLQGKSPLQKQMAQINEDARKSALAAGRAFAAAFEEGGDGLTPERAKELEKGLLAIANAYEDIADAQKDTLSASMELEVGIKEAFKTFIEEAANQAEKAKRYFNIFANGFENIFTSMTKGFPGVKRAIKDLGASLIEEFLRIQARNLLASILGGSGGSVTVGALGGIGGSTTGISAGSGLLGLLAGGKSMGRGLLDGLFTGGSGGFSPEVANATGASIFAMGFAAGGPVMANRPVMVGERGPEMFMPGVAGSIIPNNQLKGGENNSNNTNVTYNINAVDASSFRSLVARDPSFIFNISEVGRRSTPQRSV